MANEKFLDAFRVLDTELKADGISVLDFENTLPAKEQDKLKVCRIMRNYMAHNDTTFLTTTTTQVKFLEQQTSKIRKKARVVKDEMKRIKPVKVTVPIKDIINILDKNPVAVIETKEGLYLVDKDILVHQLAAGNKKIIPPKRLPKYSVVSKDTRMDSLGSGMYIVTDNGELGGVYAGILEI